MLIQKYIKHSLYYLLRFEVFDGVVLLSLVLQSDVGLLVYSGIIRYLLTYLWLLHINVRRASQIHKTPPLGSVLRQIFCTSDVNSYSEQVVG